MRIFNPTQYNEAIRAKVREHLAFLIITAF